MKLNTNKCHLIVSGHKYEHCFLKVKSDTIWESSSAKLLGITISNSLYFEEHVKNICKQAKRKLSALIRVSNYLSFAKKRVLFKAFVESQFKYNSLTWMFYNRTVNNK